MVVKTLFFILGDYGLSEPLRMLLANEKFAISFAGMEEGIGAETTFHALNKDSTWNMKPLNLKKLDLSMNPCLPRPLFTDKKESFYLPCFYRMISIVCNTSSSLQEVFYKKDVLNFFAKFTEKNLQ